MFSPKHITKLTAITLTAGAFAAPAAAAMPIGGIPTRASLEHASPAAYLAQAQRLKSGSERLFYRNVSTQALAADLARTPGQSPQLIASATPLARVTPAAAARHANAGAGGSDWPYAAVGVGGALAGALIAAGGPLALRRRRREAVPAVAIAAS